MANSLDDLEWRCSECEETGPPTAYDYMRLLKHQKGHHVRLVNKNTGEVLASSVKEARSKGIDMTSGRPVAGGEGMELTEEGITLPVTLPPVVFTLFDAAKAANLVDSDTDLDSWLFECVQSKFKLDYGLKLQLTPIAKVNE